MDLKYRCKAPEYTQHLTSVLDEAYRYSTGFSRDYPQPFWLSGNERDLYHIVNGTWPHTNYERREMSIFMKHPDCESIYRLIPKLNRLFKYNDLRATISISPRRDQPELLEQEREMISDMISASWEEVVPFYDKVLLGCIKCEEYLTPKAEESKGKQKTREKELSTVRKASEEVTMNDPNEDAGINEDEGEKGREGNESMDMAHD